MKLAIVSLLLLTCAGAWLNAQESPRIVSTTPVDRLAEKWWKERWTAKLELTKKGGADLVFIGDSITQGWEDAGRAVWEKSFAPRKAVNLGYSGDRTEHVLWRLDNGEVGGLKPKLVVMMIGTNNLGHGSSNPAQTAEGVKAILARLKAKLPGAKVLLLGIFPRDETPGGGLRKAVAEATALYKGAADGKTVHFLDIGKKFLGADGMLPKAIMPDSLHLSPEGYQIWADAIEAKVAELTK